MRRQIPYRGQVRPKLYGTPAPRNPNEKFVTRLLLVLFIAAGLAIFYFAVTLAAQGNSNGFFVFAIYLMFATVMFFAMKDAKNIKTITPDADDEIPHDYENKRLLALDYFAQIEWMNTHQQGRRAPRRDSTEPQWLYRIVRTKKRKFVERDDIFFYLSLLGICAVIGIGYLFGADLPITIVITIVGGVIFLLTYLVRT